MLRLTGSSLHRADICPPSAVLPHVETVAPAASRGIVFHSFLRDVNSLGLAEALERAPEAYRAQLAALDFDRLPLDPERYLPEVSFAYDVETGGARELGRGLERSAYQGLLRPGELAGTADVISLEEGRVTVLDYKTGRADQGPLKAHWQLSFYALCAARAYGKDEARVGIVRILEDGACVFDWETLDFFELEDIAVRLGRLVDRAREAEAALAQGKALALRTGSHCRWCPALAQCPAMASLAREVAREAVATEVPYELTQATAPVVYERVQAMKALLERVEKALEFWADNNPIPLPGGKVYGRVERPRDVFEPEKVEGVLREAFGLDFARRAIDTSPSITKEGLRKALRYEAQRDRALKVEPSLRALLDALREAGALTTRHSYPVMVHKPKAEAQEVPQVESSRKAS
jgi:hypothetical protein